MFLNFYFQLDIQWDFFPINRILEYFPISTIGIQWDDYFPAGSFDFPVGNEFSNHFFGTLQIMFLKTKFILFITMIFSIKNRKRNTDSCCIYEKKFAKIPDLQIKSVHCSMPQQLGSMVLHKR